MPKRSREGRPAAASGKPAAAAAAAAAPAKPPPVLPVARAAAKLSALVRKNAVLVLTAETGSGKSTQLPQLLLAAGVVSRSRRLVCTQPRRVAAMSLAARVASEQGCKLGQEVGYAVRFDDKTSDRTSIRYVTDGTLIREAMADPLLSSNRVVVLDEVHERSLQTDVLCGIVRRALRERDDLRVVVMSATLDMEMWRGFFSDSDPATVAIPGRLYPVDLFHSETNVADVMDAALTTCVRLHENSPKGDVLVFLPGQDEIEALSKLLRRHLPSITPAAKGVTHFAVLPLYAALPAAQQVAALAPAAKGQRKFVLATTIAETSVTIDGVKYVVDPGLVKTRTFDACSAADALRIVPVSQNQALQRAGRAGRQSRGTCYRLYTEPQLNALDVSTAPEIVRVDLAAPMLQLKAAGIGNLENLELPTPAPLLHVVRALETLYALEALDGDGAVTPAGARMAALPLPPMLARCLVLAPRFGCLEEALSAVACAAADADLFRRGGDLDSRRAAEQRHARLRSAAGDLPTLVNVFSRWQAADDGNDFAKRHFLSTRGLQKAALVRDQLARIAKKQHKALKREHGAAAAAEPTAAQAHTMARAAAATEWAMLRQCLAAGLVLNVAQTRQRKGKGGGGGGGKQDRRLWAVAAGQEVHVHPSSALFHVKPPPECVVYLESVVTSRRFIHAVTAISPGWLPKLSPFFSAPSA